MANRSAGALALLLAAPLAAVALGAWAPRAVHDDATTNDHREIAGVLREGEYTLALELRRTTWRPNAPSELAIDVPAFAEVGRMASVPGPLIRVPAGTRLRITIRNGLAQRATVHGLHDHEGARDSVVLVPGESREVNFIARRVGTFRLLRAHERHGDDLRPPRRFTTHGVVHCGRRGHRPARGKRA